MDSSPDSAERPISYSSTSSSASSRDSHCSLGSRSTLVPTSHCNPAASDRDSGAIRLELVPARQLGCGEEEERHDGGTDTGSTPRRQGSGQTPTDQSEPELSPDGGPGQVQGPRTYVDRVVQEILDTERTYVQDLRSIVQDYLECISNQSRLALSAEDKGSLFGNIREIYHFNRDLLHDLEKCNADPVAIAECFVAKSEEFHIYTQYCTNYPRSVAVLTECMRNKALAKFFRERQESLRHSLPLGSYLLKPVQRILKYHLLLHEIANHMEKDTETYEVVQEAIETMQRVAWHINDMKRKHEHAVRLQEIQSLLTNWKGPDLIGYGELVLEGTFRLQRAKNERTLFLFDKLLLITKKREETYTYKAHILCCNLMLVEVIPKEPLSFSVFHYKNPKLQHTVQAKSQQDKRMWILHLKRLILENHPAKIPAKVRAVNHPGFHYSPDGDKKDSPQTKEGPTPRRARRKGERSRETLVREGSHHPPLLRTPNVTEEPPDTPIPSLLVTGTDHQVRNIWADHRARRAMFPTRQRTMQPDDEDEDIYQMFVPTEPTGPEPETPTEMPDVPSSPRSARPCSWHVEQVPIVQIDPPPNGSRVLRRASSVGEKATETRQSPDDDQSGHSNLEVIHTESSSNEISGSSSAEQLTIDDIENVYDNISYEDLKSMGLIRRDQKERQSLKETSKDTQGSRSQAALVLDAPEVSGSAEPMIEPDSSSESNRSSTQDGAPFGTCDLKIEEENIYDTICFRESPLPEIKIMNEENKLEQERDSLLASEPDLTESLGGFVSEESLHFGEDEGPNVPHPVPCSSEPDYSSSSASETFSQQLHTGDKMSEQVDEIWNDLENYIKNNEKKADRLPAAFPVSTSESPKKTSSIKSSPTKSPPVISPQAASPPSKSPPAHQPKPPSVSTTPSFTIPKESSLKDLLFPGELAGLDSPLASSSLLLGDSVDLELMDKTKNRVFLMARQYSQKIKKANQLLRMRSMDPGDSCSRARAEKKQKDLAAILEEKKQGGAAIGARIAEYSQLYDQVMFKDPTGPGAQTSPVPHHTHPGLPSSPSMPETSLEEDWLHATYSNGELASFVSWPNEVGEAQASSTPQRRLTTACSVPALKTLPPTPTTAPSQRWSTCMSAPSEKEEHVYSSIKRHPSFNAPSSSSAITSQHNRCQSASSLGDKQQENNQSGSKRNGPTVDRSSERLHGPSLGRVGRQSSLPERSSQGHSDLTLHDGQQVVVLNRASALSILTATQNYLANFKDNGDDDDDYVEIRSEDESEQEKDRSAQRNGSSAALTDQNRGLVQSQSLPCTPVRSCNPLSPLEQERLEKYLWSEPQQSQPKIVQSLREKFQCLSSSSFA
uniref:Pleckstrin homology and RhoGEF domain containing G1 n=1 Tax=Myripristis murdjan TaxID=586833 RepID=A0A668APW6_9TELE